MSMIDQDTCDALEALVDETDLQQVLEALERIAREKAEHLRSIWQDEDAAKTWEKAAASIEKAGEAVEKACAHFLGV